MKRPLAKEGIMRKRFCSIYAVMLSCLALAMLLGMLTRSVRAAGNADPLAPDQGQPVWTPFNIFITPWTAIAPGQTLTFTHNLGGDPDQYAVELWFLDDEANGAGIHHRGYGGNQMSGQLQGAFWSHLTGDAIRVTRNPNDVTADRVRLRIWQAEPPDWDSGWLNIQPGDANIQTLVHNLGGEAEDYLVALKFRDSTPGGLGVHHYAYGGLDLGGQVQGAAWFNLSSSSVQVVRFAGDRVTSQVRVMIYRPDPARPPAYDSGWRSVNVGQMVTLNHNLGGNPMNYILRTSARSAQHGVNSFGAGGLTLSNGQGRGGFVQRLTGSSLEVYRLSQDIYQQEVRVRIWLPTYALYLPLVEGADEAAAR